MNCCKVRVTFKKITTLKNTEDTYIDPSTLRIPGFHRVARGVIWEEALFWTVAPCVVLEIFFSKYLSSTNGSCLLSTCGAKA